MSMLVPKNQSVFDWQAISQFIYGLIFTPWHSKLCSFLLYLYFLDILDGLNLLNICCFKARNMWNEKQNSLLNKRSNNAQVMVRLLLIVISWFAGLSAWSSKKVMNLTERGESFLTMGWNILQTSNSIFIELCFNEMHLYNTSLQALRAWILEFEMSVHRICEIDPFWTKKKILQKDTQTDRQTETAQTAPLK